MRVLITGATGFIGRALVPRLQRDGHSVLAWVRSETRALALLGSDVDVVSIAAGHDALAAAVSQCEAVVNLAGEPLLGRRWTADRREVLRASRIDVSTQVVAAIEDASARPRVLISASAVGFYGDRADETLDESSAPRDDFLSRLCQNWEAAAQRATAFGTRVVLLRTGVVLGRGGGALAQMLPPFEAGAGGPIGSGRQYFPWVHLRDLVNLIVAALQDERYAGPVNAVAPDVITSRSFAKALGRALRRPAFVPTPSVALRAIFGDAAVVLLASQRVEPAVSRRLGFQWEFPSIDAALENILSTRAVAIARATGPPGARYMLSSSTHVAAPIDQVFAFFSKAANLGLMTPAAMQFRIVGQTPVLSEGATVEYRIRLGPADIRWRSRILGWDPPRSFTDVQDAGPYRLWRHEHSFISRGDTTMMEDRVLYSPPLGPLGGVLEAFFIAPKLRDIFGYRAEVIALRFGSLST